MYIFVRYLFINLLIRLPMLKFQFILCCCALSAISCIDKASTDVNHGVEIAPLEPLVDYKVPVREGYTTVVSYGEETLAVARQSITIPVPVAAVQNGLIEVEYSDEDIFGAFGSSSYWQYISFEDSPKGDNDYNDVVLHCRVVSEVPWGFSNGNKPCKHIVSVQPVALGGARAAKLGILYKDDAGVIRTQILTDDIRRDLYFNDPEFPINTDPATPARKVSNYLTDFFTVTTHEPTFKVVWFIESAGLRLYAASTNFEMNRQLNMVNAQGMPYGISMTAKWRYPNEAQNIREAYPGFDAWLKTGKEETLMKDFILSKTFPATIYLNQEDGDLWTWQKRPE